MADRSVKINLGANVTGFVSGMKTAQGAATDFVGRGLDKIEQRSQSIDTLSNQAGILGAGMVAGFGAATKAAIDWESAWAGVTKTVDGSDAQLSALEESLREMARTMPATHQEIAAVAEAAGQLGVATPDVAEFVETMIQLGVTTNLTAEEAATSLARISNIMGTSSDDVDRMGATIVELGNNSATTEAEIVELSTRLAAAGKQAGLTESDIFAIASTLTSVGVEAEAGGTAMSKVFTSISDAARDGGDNLETFAQVSGVTAEEFRRAFEEDAAGAIGMFVEGMGRMSAEGESTSQVFKDLGLTDQRLMRAIMSAGSATGLWADQLGLASDAWGENTALVDEAMQRFQTAESQMTVAWNNIKDAAIEFGAVVLPMVADVAGAISDLAREFGELPDWAKTAAMAIAGGGGFALLSVAAIGKVLTSLAATKTALTALNVPAGAAAGAVGKIGAAAAGVAATAAAAGMLVEALTGHDAVMGSNALQQAIRDIVDSNGDLSALNDQFERTGMVLGMSRVEAGSLSEAFDQMLNPSTTDRIAGFFDSIPGVTGYMEILEDRVRGVDTELANMIAAGEVEAVQEFTQALMDQGYTADELARLLPGTTDALIGVEGASDEATGAQAALEAQTNATTGAADAQTESLEDLIGAQAELAGVVLSAREAERQFEESVDAATAAVAENGRTLDVTTAKGRANQAALDDIADAGWKMIESAQANGATQEQLQGIMSRSRERFIATAEAMGMSSVEAGQLADQLGLIPSQVTSNVSVNGIDTALSRLGVLDSTLNSINGKSVSASVTVVRHGQAALATGGYVRGPGTGTSDSIPAMLSNGEYVVKAAAVQKYGPGFLNAVNNMQLQHRAEGGPVAPMQFASGGRVPSVNVAAPSLEGMAISGRLELDRDGFATLVDGRIMAANRQAVEASRRGVRR